MHLSKPVKTKAEIIQIGTISANNDSSIGHLIADAMDKVGKDGVITVEEANSMETIVEFTEGMQFDRGYLSPYFVTDIQKMETRLKDPYILIISKKIDQMKELLPLLELVAKSRRPLLIIAEDISGNALATLIVNKIRSTLKVAAVKSPGFGDNRKEILEDIAALCRTRVISEELGTSLNKIRLEDLGTCKSIRIDKDSTTIVDGKGSKRDIQCRIYRIRNLIEISFSEYDRKKLQERMAKLTGGVAVIRIGAASEIELKEKKARVENALSATKAAVEEGIVAGGGVALVRCLPVLENLEMEGDENRGVDILKKAMTEPLKQIANNAGAEGAVVLNRILGKAESFGFNAQTLIFEDLEKAGVIDPAKVVRAALQNAASIAGLMLTTGAMIVEK